MPSFSTSKTAAQLGELKLALPMRNAPKLDVIGTFYFASAGSRWACSDRAGCGARLNSSSPSSIGP